MCIFQNHSCVDVGSEGMDARITLTLEPGNDFGKERILLTVAVLAWTRQMMETSIARIYS